ncbi:MAG: hypothetical protein ACI8PZ_003756 [Myxococcota bacterium]
MTFRLAAITLLWAISGVARAQDDPPDQGEEEAAREADLFGGPSTDEADREADLFGGAPSSDEDREAAIFGGEGTAPVETASDAADAIRAKIREQDRTFTIGGRLWLQLQGRATEDTDSAEGVALSSPNLLELFGDARPNDRVRAYVRARLQHDWTVHQTRTDATGQTVDAVTGEPVDPSLFGAATTPTQVVLDQLWVKFDAGRKVYATVGRQRIKWGAGRFWNPSDFMNQQRLDPLAVLDLRTGVSLVKLHVPFEAAGANVYAIANLDQANALDQVGGAARVEWLFGQTEFALSSALRKDQPVRLGADVSSGVSVFDVRLEGALQHGNAAPHWRGTWNYTELPPSFPVDKSRDEEWIAQVVAGADVSIRYSDQDSIVLGAEAFYNGAGYSDAELLPWMFLTGTYTPLYTGTWYIAGYALLAGPGQWDDHSFSASFIGNLSDHSEILRFDYRVTALTWLDLNAFVSDAFGKNGELHYRLNLPAMPEGIAAGCALDPECAPFAEVLADRLRVPAPTVTVGLGAAVRF